jgi:hypothetical protein
MARAADTTDTTRQPAAGEFRLTLRAEPGFAGPVAVRLRRALKCLLRSFGLRCTRAEPAVPGEPAGGGDDGG